MGEARAASSAKDTAALEDLFATTVVVLGVSLQRVNMYSVGVSLRNDNVVKRGIHGRRYSLSTSSTAYSHSVSPISVY